MNPLSEVVVDSEVMLVNFALQLGWYAQGNRYCSGN